MSVRLRPLREDEYADFAANCRREYAEELERNGGFTREAAGAKADREFAQLLSEGLATPGHTITAVEETTTGERVGRLWFADRELGGRQVTYVYDISIDERHRGRGLGRAAMLALEQEAARRGHEVVELNVFGGNARARALYGSLGYVEMAVQMRKQLGANP